MKRVGFVLKVKREKIAEYREHHKKVWPEMLRALERAGWHNYSLYMRTDGTLFGYVETPHGLDAARAAMAQEEVNARGQSFMSPFFEAPEGSAPDQMMQELEEVFHLD
jgi:L-rhamnose mutarotase